VSPRTVEASPVSLAFDALAARTPAGAWEAPVTLTRSLVTLSLGNVAPLTFGPTTVLDRAPRRHVAGP
jgi:hypothetical protein